MTNIGYCHLSKYIVISSQAVIKLQAKRWLNDFTANVLIGILCVIAFTVMWQPLLFNKYSCSYSNSPFYGRYFIRTLQIALHTLRIIVNGTMKVYTSNIQAALFRSTGTGNTSHKT